MKAKLILALIHNNDQARYKKIKPALEQLKKGLNQKYEVEIIEISKQPKLVPHPTWFTLMRKSIYWKLNREWEEYKGFNSRNILLDATVLLRRLIITLINRKRENKRGVVETYLVDKHIRAWNYFLEKDSDLLVCFEDDAVFKRNSINNMKKIIGKVIKIKTQPVYVDLAGGNSPEINRVDKLEISKDDLGSYYKKPVTNTACCYLINQKTAEIINENLLKRIWIRLVGADWLMNKVFIQTASKYKYFCFHADPPIFNHGSLDGTYNSSI